MESAGRGYLGRGAGADGCGALRRGSSRGTCSPPISREQHGPVTDPRSRGRPAEGRLRASPGSSRCALAVGPLLPGRTTSAPRWSLRAGPRVAGHCRDCRLGTICCQRALGRALVRGHDMLSAPTVGASERGVVVEPWFAGTICCYVPISPGGRQCAHSPRAGRRRCSSGEQGPEDVGSSGRTQGSRAGAPSGLRGCDTGLVKVR